jgi:elongation factor G
MEGLPRGGRVIREVAGTRGVSVHWSEDRDWAMANDNDKRPWLIEIPIEPKSRDDRERLAAALARLAAEDPAFGFSMHPVSGPVLLKGMGELHLDIKIGILRRDIKVDIFRRPHKIDFNVGAPHVAYREKITRTATVDYVYGRQSSGVGQFARVKIVCEPRPSDSGFKFENWVVSAAMPREFLAGVERGLEGGLGAGVVAGCPVVDLKVTLVDGVCHPFDSSALAFELAAREALREALNKGASVLLEPVMHVEVVTPDDHTRLVVGDLNARRGQILGQDICGNANIINARVPLANMFGYAKILRSISQGRANSIMQFDHYAPVPSPESYPAVEAAGHLHSVGARTTGMEIWTPAVAAVARADSRETIV